MLTKSALSLKFRAHIFIILSIVQISKLFALINASLVLLRAKILAVSMHFSMGLSLKILAILLLFFSPLCYNVAVNNN